MEGMSGLFSSRSITRPTVAFCKGQSRMRSALPVAVGGYGTRWRQDRSHSTHEGEKRVQKGPTSWEKGGTEELAARATGAWE